MSKKQYHFGGYTTTQFVSLVIAGTCYLLAVGNVLFNWNFFALSPSIFSFMMIFCASVILWLFVALDWPSLLCILSLGFLPEVGFNEAGKLAFGNSTFIFLLFTFIVTYSLNQSTLLNRMTAKAMNGRVAQSNPWRFIVMMLLVFLLLATFLSPTVLFMFALPLYEEVCLQFGLSKGDKLPAYFLISLFMTIAIGTAMTPINHVFAITAMSLYEATTKQVIGYGQYMALAVPIGLIIFMALLLTLKVLIYEDVRSLKTQEVKSLSSLPSIQRNEFWLIGLFVLMVFLWLFPELGNGMFPGLASAIKKLGIAFPPFLVTILLAVISIDNKCLINIQEAIQKGVHWPSLLLVAATMTLGTVMALPELGLLDLLSKSLNHFVIQLAPWFIILFFIAWAGIQTNFSSNLVTVSMVTSLMLSISPLLLSSEINIAVLACFIGFMASLAWMTPPAMPYVAISIGSRWTQGGRVFIMGLWMLILAILIVSLIGYPLGNYIF